MKMYDEKRSSAAMPQPSMGRRGKAPNKEAGIEAIPRARVDMIARQLVRDDQISFRALGVAVRLLSNAPGYKMTSKDLARDRPEGRDAVRKALNELEAIGYLRRTRRQLENGQWVTDMVISDKTPSPPRSETASSAQRPNQSPAPEIPASAPRPDPLPAPEITASVPRPDPPPAPEIPASVPRPDPPPAPEIPASVPRADPPLAPEAPASASESDSPTLEILSSVPRPEPPTPENPTVGGTGPKSSNSSTRKSSTTTTTGLSWPPGLSPEECVVVEKAIQGLESVTQQQLLDELAGSKRSSNPPRRLASWMHTLRKRHESGQFVPDAGLSVAKERARRSMEANERQERRRAASQRAQASSTGTDAVTRLARARKEAGL